MTTIISSLASTPMPKGVRVAWTVKATSATSGRIVWVLQNGMPTESQDNAGRFSLEDANYWRTQLELSMPSWTVDVDRSDVPL